MLELLRIRPLALTNRSTRSGRSGRRWALAAALVVLALAAHTPRLQAQVLAGTVRDSASQQPLPNTRVLTLDPAGRPTASVTTDQQGRFRISPWTSRAAARSGSVRLRVLRMGFRPRELPVDRSAAAAAFDVSLVPFPIVLEKFEITAASCPKRADRAAALGLLQQVRMALFATVLARSQSSATMTRLLYDRRVEPRTGRILGQSVWEKVTSATTESFTAARSATAFNRQGFVRDSSGGHRYFGPDAETLIDDAFASRYCVRLAGADRTRPGLVGLGFEPVDREDGRIDIVGTVWIDTLSRVLQDLNFRYVGLDRETTALAPEGRLSFRELPNGVVIIDQWSLRLAGDRAQQGGAVPEIGGEIVRARWPDGSSWHASLGTVRLHVVDRQGRPASAASVELVDTDYRPRIDSSGTLELNDLLPGPYTAIVRDPRLVALGVPARTTTLRFIAARDSTKEALLEVETADDVARARCGAEVPTASRAWVLGRVVTPNDQPVRDARWSIRDEFGATMVEDGKVDADGLFQYCRLPMNARVNIDVWRDTKRASASRIVMEPLTTLHFVLPQ
jgi:hypothetical protein